MLHNADDSGFDQPSLDELITLREAAELSGLSASYLRLLVSRGDIWGMKLDPAIILSRSDAVCQAALGDS